MSRFFLSCLFVLLLTACAAPAPSEVFRDEFEGSLAEGWTWLREDADRWSVSARPGWLQVVAGFGTLNGGNMSNVLLRPAPQGDFQIETKLDFQPQTEPQFAGLVIYESASDHVQFGRVLCNAPECLGDSLHFDLMSDGRFESENFASALPGAGTIYLRLHVQGARLSAYASADGGSWTLIGERAHELKPEFVGLMAGQAFDRALLIPAQFDFFQLAIFP